MCHLQNENRSWWKIFTFCISFFDIARIRKEQSKYLNKKGRVNRKEDARDIRRSKKRRRLFDANYAIN